MRADLASLQQKFALALIDSDALEPVLSDFKGRPEINRARYACYRTNVNGIWQQSCANAYPVLRQLLGNDFFDELSYAYGVAHPSQSGNLSEFGAAMPEFIRAQQSCANYPYLADVAALEWLMHRAYFLKYARPVTLTEFATIPIDRLSDLRCQLQPCCALLKTDWAAAEIWQNHQLENATVPDNVHRPSANLVWRHPWQTNWQIQVSELSIGSYAALVALRDGDTLGTALQAALAVEPEFAVQSELANWLQKNLIISLTLNEKI